MSIVTKIIVVTLFASVAPTSAGGSFLRASQAVDQLNTRQQAEASLLAELAGTFRPGRTQDHIVKIEQKLKPMCAAVPQDADGTFPHSVVRYVLHRFFAQRGWFIRGLEPSATKKQDAADKTLQDLQEWVPSFLQEFLEQLHQGRGLSVRELAVLVATLEDLIHKESTRRLTTILDRLELGSVAVDETTNTSKYLYSEENVKEVLDFFMMSYQLGPEGEGSLNKSKDVMRTKLWVFANDVKDWKEMQDWMQSIKLQVHPHSPVDFDGLVSIVEAIGEHYGAYNINECSRLKAELLGIESTKAGRVQLSEFYKKGLTGVFEFNEKRDYLRDLGVLDESDPKQPHVIVPNYVSSRPNCLTTSTFYTICCRSECEDLMGRLEREIGQESATPEQVLSIVAQLPSDTVEAPRKLSATSIQRLEKIASSNYGHVPLHGRLFAQWMHHEFPRECPFPHEGGRINPQTPDEWMKENGQKGSKLSQDELQAHLDERSRNCDVDGDCTHNKPTGTEARAHHHLEENLLPWSESEELLMPVQRRPQGKLLSALRKVVGLVILGSLALAAKIVIKSGPGSSKMCDGSSKLV
jgi:hypothetical protein